MMKKLKNSFFAVCLSILFMFGSFVPCLQVNAEVSDLVDVTTYYHNNFYKFFKELTGVILSPAEGTIDHFYEWVTSHSSDYGATGLTGDQFVSNNISIDQSNDTIVCGNNLVNAMRDYAKSIVDSDNFTYIYSWEDSTFLTSFSSMDKYNDFISFVEENEDQYIIFYNADQDFILTFDNNDIFIRNANNNKFPSNILTRLLLPSGIEPEANIGKKIYAWGGLNFGYITQEYTNISSGGYVKTKADKNTEQRQNKYFLVNSEVKQYKLYNTFEDYQNSSSLPGYYVTDSYNTEHIEGSYNTSISNIDNSITYNIVNNYIDDYTRENGEPPTPEIIYIYINNYIPPSPTPTPDPNPDPTPTPNPDDGNNNDFDWSWLGDIGDFIGGLLSGLGGIITGLLDGISGIIDLFIGTENPETGQREGGLPSIAGQLLQYFLPFLPPEMLTLIELSIVLALIVGIVKLIRGS